MASIDLNSDLGEGFGPWTMGDDAAMLSLVTSANVACGGHAGDAETMYATCRIAAANGVVVGAHPGYVDREGFGRRIIPMRPDEIGRMVLTQVGALAAIQLPRNPTPGPVVSAGSVIIAGQQCLIIPIAMSTGWFAIGRTAARVLTGDSERPFLFDVGDTVTFRRIDATDLLRQLDRQTAVS